MDHLALMSMNQQEAYNLLFLNYPDVVNVTEMREMLGGISNKTAYKLLHDNRISHFKIGRVYKIPKINILVYLNLFVFTFDRPHGDDLVH